MVANEGMTSGTPASKGAKISPTESTKATFANVIHVSLERLGNVSHHHCMRFMILECLQITPLASPVEPEVYIIQAVSRHIFCSIFCLFSCKI